MAKAFASKNTQWIRLDKTWNVFIVDNGCYVSFKVFKNSVDLKNNNTGGYMARLKQAKEALQEAYNLGLEQNRKLMGKYEKEQVMIRSMYKSIKDLN